MRTKDRRHAAIEAATAAEIALSQAGERHLTGLPAGGADWIMRRSNGIAALAQMLKAFEGTSGASKLAERIAGPRNKAVHRGVLPTEDEVNEAFDAAYQILRMYSPLPGWK